MSIERVIETIGLPASELREFLERENHGVPRGRDRGGAAARMERRPFRVEGLVLRAHGPASVSRTRRFRREDLLAPGPVRDNLPARAVVGRAGDRLVWVRRCPSGVRAAETEAHRERKTAEERDDGGARPASRQPVSLERTLRAPPGPDVRRCRPARVLDSRPACRWGILAGGRLSYPGFHLRGGAPAAQLRSARALPRAPGPRRARFW